jgi:hypothetical protein
MRKLMPPISKLWYLIALLIVFHIPAQPYAQITISQPELMEIFTPPNPLFVIPGEAGSINIGGFGGPNDYDFTFVDMHNIHIMNNYDIDLIPVLADRYPSGSTTIGEAPDALVENPIFYSSNDSTYFAGEATIEDEYLFAHFEPYELFSGFPMNYLDNFWQVIDVYDTTYNLNWQILDIYHYEDYLGVTVDGYGTLRLPGHDLECLRMKREYSWYQYKEFLYVTGEGVLLVVTDAWIAEPDTGYIDADYQVLMSYGFVGVDDKESTPAEFKLLQNYPNPFNASTTIRYSLSEPSDVTIEIFDILGRRVSILQKGTQPAGYHQALWNAGDMPSGVYFYKMQAGEFSEINRMVLLK